MPYRIRVPAEAKRDLRELPGHVRERAWRLIDSLADQPRPLGAKELRDNPGVYRLRLDRWRLSYEVSEDDQIVLVLAVRRKTGPETYTDLG